MAKLVLIVVVGTGLLLFLGGLVPPLNGRDDHPESRLAMSVLGLFILVVPVLLGILGMVDAARRQRSERRRRKGLCVHCGYDLSASPGKCPECGRWTYRKPASR